MSTPCDEHLSLNDEFDQLVINNNSEQLATEK